VESHGASSGERCSNIIFPSSTLKSGRITFFHDHYCWSRPEALLGFGGVRLAERVERLPLAPAGLAIATACKGGS
jgi:hypothetical protein